MLEWPLILLLFFIGIGVAIIVSMVGLGGGIFFIPILILIFKIDANLAIGTSVFCMTVSTFSATINYWKQKRVDLKLAIAYDLFDIPGIILGGILTKVLPLEILEIICGITISILAVTVIFKKDGIDKSKPLNSIGTNQTNSPQNQGLSTPQTHDFSFAWKGRNFGWVVISSFLGGLMTGMVGLGGGTVDTTTMILLGVPTHIAVGSSAFAMFLTNAFGTGTHWILGNIYWDFAIPIALGALIGAQIGSNLAKKVNAKILRKILGAAAAFSGIRLLI